MGGSAFSVSRGDRACHFDTSSRGEERRPTGVFAAPVVAPLAPPLGKIPAALRTTAAPAALTGTVSGPPCKRVVCGRGNGDARLGRFVPVVDKRKDELLDNDLAVRRLEPSAAAPAAENARDPLAGIELRRQPEIAVRRNRPTVTAEVGVLTHAVGHHPQRGRYTAMQTHCSICEPPDFCSPPALCRREAATHCSAAVGPRIITQRLSHLRSVVCRCRRRIRASTRANRSSQPDTHEREE